MLEKEFWNLLIVSPSSHYSPTGHTACPVLPVIYLFWVHSSTSPCEMAWKRKYVTSTTGHKVFHKSEMEKDLENEAKAQRCKGNVEREH